MALYRAAVSVPSRVQVQEPDTHGLSLRGCSRSWPGTRFLFPGSDGFQQPCVPSSPQQRDDFQLLALPCLAAAGSACSCPLLSLDSSGWMDSILLEALPRQRLSG